MSLEREGFLHNAQKVQVIKIKILVKLLKLKQSFNKRYVSQVNNLNILAVSSEKLVKIVSNAVNILAAWIFNTF